MEPETENGSECEGIMEDGAGQGHHMVAIVPLRDHQSHLS